MTTAAFLVQAIPGQATAGTISGRHYWDRDASGGWSRGDEPMPSVRLYLFDSAGKYLANTVADDQGWYRFENLPSGDYRLQLDNLSWWPIRNDFVPTTTGSIFPRSEVSLGVAASADFGWRAIVRSTMLGAPVTSYCGSSGLCAESYNDVLGAREIHDAAMQGLVGSEASSVIIRFGWSTASTTSSSIVESGGQYVGFSAAVYVSWESWLDGGDQTLSHEYGHAWSQFHAYRTQQDPALLDYLDARGLTGDPRLGTSYAFSIWELVAEDYRQLFGSQSARAAPQINRDIPSASDVPGLLEYLRDGFTQAGAPAPPPGTSRDLIETLSVSPSPVKSSGEVSLLLNAPATLTVEILTAGGRLVKTLAREIGAPAGAHAFKWNRKDESGRRVPRGSYLARATAVAGTREEKQVSFIVE